MPTLRTTALAMLPARAVHAYRVLHHLYFRPYEPEIREVPRFLGRDRASVEVGANVGLFATVLARYSKRLVVFEPHPDCAEHLRRIGLRNTAIVEKAASDALGRATLRVPLNLNTEMHALSTIDVANSFATERRADRIVEYVIEKTTLDAELKTLLMAEDRVGFIKIDAEGHEHAVLMGAEHVLQCHRPVFLIELEYRHGSDVDATFRFLTSRNYHALALRDGRSLEPIDAMGLKALQSEVHLLRKLAHSSFTDYVNNVFFLPNEQRQ
jgi:FkbM family methyltransferase